MNLPPPPFFQVKDIAKNLIRLKDVRFKFVKNTVKLKKFREWPSYRGILQIVCKYNCPAEYPFCLGSRTCHVHVHNYIPMSHMHTYISRRGYRIFWRGGGVMATRGGVIGGDRPCRRKITIWTHKIFSYKGGDHPYPPLYPPLISTQCLLIILCCIRIPWKSPYEVMQCWWNNRYAFPFSAIHEGSFISFMVFSLVYMLLSCILMKWGHAADGLSGRVSACIVSNRRVAGQHKV